MLVSTSWLKIVLEQCRDAVRFGVRSTSTSVSGLPRGKSGEIEREGVRDRKFIRNRLNVFIARSQWSRRFRCEFFLSSSQSRNNCMHLRCLANLRGSPDEKCHLNGWQWILMNFDKTPGMAKGKHIDLTHIEFQQQAEWPLTLSGSQWLSRNLVALS